MSSTKGTLPLTACQNGIWFDQMVHQDKPFYNMGGHLRFRGPIDRDLFERAIGILIEENDALRIVLREAGDVPEQEVLPHFRPALDYFDLSSKAGAREEWAAWMSHRIDVPFTMFGEPLFYFAFARLSDDEYSWFHVYHHLIIDAYGHSLLVQHLAVIYSSLVSGDAGDPIPRGSFADYVLKETDVAHSRRLAEDLRYWEERFQSIPAAMIERQGFGTEIRSRRSVLMISRQLYDRMQSFASSHGVSTFHLILAALYIRFAQPEGREDFIIGLPTLNRSNAVLKRTVGLFTSVTPSWFRLGLDLSVVELLKAIGRELRKDYRHQRCPLHEINRRVGLHKEGRPQLYDIVLTYQKHNYAVEFDGIQVEQVSMRHGSEKTPLAIEVSEYNEELDVRMNIDHSLTAFSVEAIEFLKRELLFLFEEIVSHPDTAIRDLAILPPDERELVLTGFHPDRVTHAPCKTLVDLIEEQVERSPDAEAISFEGVPLTYSELNRRANIVAAHLTVQGIRPGAFVGICMERSSDLVTGIVGILKAGGAYVPIDPAYPVERQELLLTDSGVRVVVGTDPMAVSADGVEFVSMDSLDFSQSASNPTSARRPSPSDPAYLIYTSGSTGRPKGTIITHYNVVRLLQSTSSLYEFGPQDIWTLFHSFAFDLSVWEIFACLGHGGKLVIIPYWVSRSPDDSYRWLSEHKVTMLTQTPSAFKQLMKAEEQRDAELRLRLRWVILGGEEVAVKDLAGWFERHGDESPRVMNMYGITETTVHTTYRRLVKADVAVGRSVIGPAMEDMWIYILDSVGKPVPVGVAGEIYVGGAGVAAGYLNRPDLNAERFLADPFRDEPGARVYRSGDLARYLSDGDIEFLGRKDGQVKIRGYRVETEEIKASVARHPKVHDCVVTAHFPERAGLSGDAELRAYVIAADPADPPSVSELRAFLQQTLPDYMLPSSFMTLASFPLTANGKIDLRALPSPGERRPKLSEELAQPLNHVEASIAAIWAEELRIDQVGIHDNFFDLGGDSLVMVRVRRRIGEASFGRLPSMREMFEYPTIHMLAGAISHTGDAGFSGLTRTVVPEVRRTNRAQQRSARKASRAGSTSEGGE